MTHSTPAQTTHTTAHQSPVSIKSKTGSPKPDISKSKEKTIKAVVELVTPQKPLLMQLSIGQLVKSTLNVRKAKVSKEDDEQLYASLLSHGVIQNLLVEPANKQGLYPVLGGGRRFKQLLKLVKDKKLALDSQVPVKILSEAEVLHYAAELSLSENFIRAKMHPADEFHAFAAMVEKGSSFAEVAARFGVKEKFVQQRMKLSGIAPVILDAYKKNEISLDVVMVFTLADVTQQVAVWEKAGKCRYSESQFRHMLKSEALSADNYLVEFVGQEAYEQAGGIVTADMFEEEVYFDDKALIESLATAKLETQGGLLVAQGWKWTQVKLVTDYDDTKGFDTIAKNDEGEYDPSEMVLAGCILVLRNWGDEPITVYKGLVAKADKKALALLKVSALPETGADRTGGAQTPEINAETGYSGALIEDLKAQRLITAKHALMSAPSVALNALHFSVCVSTFSNASYGLRPLHISIHNTVCFPKQGALSDNKALGLIEKIKSEFDLSWTKLSTVTKQFSAFCLLDSKEKEKQVAYATAMMLEASFRESNEAVEAVISTLDVKWSNYWRPNAETFFKRVNQPCLLEMAKPAMSEQWIQQGALLKKKDLATQIDTLVNGDGKQLNEQQQAYFDVWMPTGF